MTKRMNIIDRRPKAWAKDRRVGAAAKLAVLGVASVLVSTGCAASAPATGTDSGKPLIGFTSRFISGNTWLESLSRQVQTHGKELGYDVEALDARGSAQTQIQQMQTFITRGAKAIVLEPIDDRSVAAGVEATIKAGIPLIVVNDELAPDLAAKVACNVHSDQFQLGSMVGEKVAEAVAKKFTPADTVKLYIMGILPQEPLTTNREEGFMKGYNDYFKSNEGPKLERIPNGYGSALPDQTLPIMRDKLSANPDVDVIFNMTDTVHGAVAQALSEAGLVNDKGGASKVIVGSMDGRMSVVKDMAETPGFPIVANSLTAPAASATLAVNAADRAVKAGSGNGPVCEGKIPTEIPPVEVVTLETAKQYYDAKFEFAEPSLAKAAAK
ncbi:sugar ABC transporter substrate-binding protein [Pseudarthrobacter oxydans]|uniref:sugar ABC transporter substrate-binding protein n=1 Tax=Pseudarthrobacter oxydans TaxID=1671 RepID=UPI003432C835